MSVNPRINITTINSIDTKTACFNRARYYDPSLERFLGEDPIGLKGGYFNVYKYVANSPINFIDPSGLEAYDYPPYTDPNDSNQEIIDQDNDYENYIKDYNDKYKDNYFPYKDTESEGDYCDAY